MIGAPPCAENGLVRGMSVSAASQADTNLQPLKRGSHDTARNLIAGGRYAMSARTGHSGRPDNDVNAVPGRDGI
jgi:hypothetical protein